MLPRLLGTLVLGLMSAAWLTAQTERGIEVYGLTGGFSEWIKRGYIKPEFGAGILLPFTKNWAVLTDFTIGVQRVNELKGVFHRTYEREFYERNPQLMNNDVTKRRYITLRPSAIRLWRYDSFRFYVGIGWGAEIERGHFRFQRIRVKRDEQGNRVHSRGPDVDPSELADAEFDLVRDEQFTEHSQWLRHFPLIGRFGITADIRPKWVLRAGYSCLMLYFDEPLSGAIEIGVGYRF